MRIAVLITMVSIALAAGCADRSAPTATAADESQGRLAANVVPQQLPPIRAEPLTGRHAFTDDVAVQVRVKPGGRPTRVVNMQDASNTAVVRFTVQPGVRFPWHTHPGLVIVTVTQGELVFVLADDCVQRPYSAGTAFIDPGFGNVHYAFNRSGGETVLVATFLGVPATGGLTNPVGAAESMALDAKCGVAAAMSHTH